MTEYPVFQQLMSDVISQDNILLIVRNGPVVCEAKTGGNLPFRIREKWATIGDDASPWHIHINLEEISSARFVKEVGSEGKMSFSIRFYDSKDNMYLKAYFAKMYDKDGKIIDERVAEYDRLFSKYGSKELVGLR